MQGYAKAEQGLTRIFFEGFPEWCGDNALLLDFGVFGRVVEPPAQIGADNANGNAEQEGQVPPPGETISLRQGRIEQRCSQGAERRSVVSGTFGGW